MHNRFNALFSEQLRKGIVQHRPPRDTRKNQAGAVGHLAGFEQNLQRPPAERNSMLALHLHPVSRNGPSCCAEVDFIPAGLPHLT